MQTLLSVIVPCYNESEAIELYCRAVMPILEGLKGLSVELIFVDDGSDDDTLEKLNRIAEENPMVRVYSLSRNFGHQIALTAGLDAAVGDAIIMMDSDLQHPPSLIPELVRLWLEGNDIVLAIRERTEGVSLFKSVTSRFFYIFFNWLSNTKVPSGAADFCLISRRVAQPLRKMPERHRFLRGLINWAGFRRAFVHYQSPKRAAGQSKYNLIKMLALSFDALFSFSAEPLRLTLRTGLVVTVSGFFYLAWTLIKGYLLHALVPGYSSLIGVVIILGGFQLTFIGLIGEYLARVFEQVKGRPLYLLKQEPSAKTNP